MESTSLETLENTQMLIINLDFWVKIEIFDSWWFLHAAPGMKIGTKQAFTLLPFSHSKPIFVL
jgi:hypothetical protein